MRAQIRAFFDPATWTMSYVVYDEQGGFCAIIDPVLDYDPKSGRTKTVSADKLIDFVRENRLTVEWLLETHAHADHLSAAAYLQDKVGGKTAIGESIVLVQGSFKKLFNLGPEFVADGLHFDHRITDGEVLRVGRITLKAISVPGHTPADMAYQLDDAVFVGDTLFMPDYGTARADFPGGDARTLTRAFEVAEPAVLMTAADGGSVLSTADVFLRVNGWRLQRAPMQIYAEMMQMFEEQVAPRIRVLAPSTHHQIRLRTFGMPESAVGEKLAGLEEFLEGKTLAEVVS